MGDGNDTFATADPISVGTLGAPAPEQGALEPPGTDKDYYTFTGVAGQAIAVITDAKPQSAEYDPTYPDLVVTVFDAAMNKIAENDDPFPRTTNDSSLATILPFDGTYYVLVQECNAWESGGPQYCGALGDIFNTDYALWVLELDPASNGTVEETEPNGDGASANAMEYEPSGGSGSGYFATTAFGHYGSTSDVDVYSFALPADLTIADGRVTAYFSLAPPGVDNGNGASAPPGLVYVVDPAAPSNAVARIAPGAGGFEARELAAPLDLGKSYWLFVEHPAMALGARPFYFVTHYGGGSNPVETELAGENDTEATAEPATGQYNGDGTYSYFLEGDLTGGASDVDVWSIDVPDPSLVINVACGAHRVGSGLRDLEIALVSGGVVVDSALETETVDAGLQQVPVPPGATSIALRLSAGWQDSTVTTGFYRCGVHLGP